MKKIVALVMVVATLALSSTAVMAAPTQGAVHAADQAGLFSRVLSFFASLFGDTPPAHGRGDTVKSPGNAGNSGAIWTFCYRGTCYR
jgi:hypothetical protein